MKKKPFFSMHDMKLPPIDIPPITNQIELDEILEAIRNAGDKLPHIHNPFIHVDVVGFDSGVDVVGESRQGN